MSANRVIYKEEIAEHTYLHDCWVVLYNQVYDLTSYLQHHPGGSSIILNHAGKDATAIFETVHSQIVLSTFQAIGILSESDRNHNDTKTHVSIFDQYRINNKLVQLPSMIPQSDELITVHMFKHYALQMMTARALNYCVSGADDEITFRANAEIYSKIALQPSTTITDADIDTNCTLFRSNCSLPLFLSPTGMNKLFHPNGELAVIDGCYKQNIIPIIAMFSSYSIQQISEFSNIASKGTQTIWYQLYISPDHNVTKLTILNALKLGCNTFVVTVDAPQCGARERDIRYNLKLKDIADDDSKSNFVPPIVRDMQHLYTKRDNAASEGTAGRLSSFLKPSLTWNDIIWIRLFIDEHNTNDDRATLILKGIQCVEDVLKVMDNYSDAVDGIILSNHGGRQLDTARTSMEVLEEVMNCVDYKQINIDIYIDGGIMSGLNIFKALAIGAKGVGIGRAYLYGLTCYGSKGVQRIIEILRNELKDAMRAMNITSLQQISRNMLVNTNKRQLMNHHTICPFRQSKM